MQETRASSAVLNVTTTRVGRSVNVHSLLPRRISAPREEAAGAEERPDDSTEGPGGMGGANIPWEEWGTAEWGCE